MKFAEGTTSLKEPFSQEEAIQLVEAVRVAALQQRTIEEIQQAIEHSPNAFLKKLASPEDAERAISFALKLWLFTKPTTLTTNHTITQVVKAVLPTKTCFLPSSSSAATTKLLEDFCAKSLTRKGGFHLIGTADISQHLAWEGPTHLKVFCHAQILKHYQRSAERILYPDGFLDEVDRTLNLLFPSGKLKAQRRVRKISRKQGWDIESYRVEDSLVEATKYQCSSYAFFGERLAEVQKRYAKARPHTLVQWWYDRRNPREWATLWVAVLVFVLTVIFGLISAVTGILQVYASFHFKDSGR